MRHDAPQPPDSSAFNELDNAFARAAANADDNCDVPEPSHGKTVLLTVVFAIAVLLLAAVIAYTSSVVAVNRAAKHTDRRVEVLEKDLQQRRAAAAEQNANRDRQIAELRRLVCVFANHSQPRDVDIEQIRLEYGCSTPGASPSPTG